MLNLFLLLNVIMTIISMHSALLWHQRGSDIDGESSYDYNGKSVSLSSDGYTVAVGAPSNDGTGSSAGHVRVYGYDDSTTSWIQRGSDIKYPDLPF
jgi:hypothetical protein